MIKSLLIALILAIAVLNNVQAACRNPSSPTTASGWKAPKGPFCSGQLIFEDNFNRLDRAVWEHENSLGGGGNNEFQWYSGGGRNSYVKDGHFYLRPTLTADEFGEEFLTSGTIDLNQGPTYDRCTDEPSWAAQIQGCYRKGSPSRILNPVRSARVRTVNAFAYKYGRLEIRARLPAGDWIWPALWLLPKGDTYGWWPKSGEIDLMESRGNRNLWLNNENIGVKKVSSCLHFGENSNYRSMQCGSASSQNGFDGQFNNYQLTWTPNVVQFGINGKVFWTVTPYEGFWKLGGFSYNPWPTGTKMAPFDREFYPVMNVAVGGDYFPDNAWNPHRKPWAQGSPSAMTDFYKAKSQWYGTWGEEAALQIDYVRVWAI
ncbi:beta-1,3-glucan-binding protein-like [Culex pipiens pallens]|uniref:beta-1,3-glucan-binding protein-like n=1 Tax=Culex pipiens pallens TaxID=42434 RepID=UPI001952EFEA|nr:beta-1,3-glucan-binding protein-like [Culex pipiens pallens]